MTPAEVTQLAHTVVALTFLISAVLGVVMSRTDFCTMGAVSDIVNLDDWTRMRMWLGAMGVAILGTQGLAAAGLIDPGRSLYAAPRLLWLSHLLGGLLFGFGMVLASGCGTKTLLRLGAGNLKSLVVFVVMGVFAYMSLRGLFAVWRVNSIDLVNLDLKAGQDLPRLIAASEPQALRSVRLWLGLLSAGALIAFSLASASMRKPQPLLGALTVGLGITAVWYVSGHLGYIAEDPSTLEERFAGSQSGRPESLSFVAPAAYSLELLMLWSDQSKVLTLGIASVLGMTLGSTFYALATRRFRWEGFRGAEDTANHLIGAALMGIGGVCALGCTIGQGLSGISTLAIGSFITLAAIVGGAVAALRYQIWRVERMA
jgi:hypothetical protein